MKKVIMKEGREKVRRRKEQMHLTEYINAGCFTTNA